MPWTPAEATRFTHKANTPEKKKIWSEVSTKTLARTGSESSAIREANAIVNRMGGRYRKP